MEEADGKDSEHVEPENAKIEKRHGELSAWRGGPSAENRPQENFRRSNESWTLSNPGSPVKGYQKKTKRGHDFAGRSRDFIVARPGCLGAFSWLSITAPAGAVTVLGRRIAASGK
jgi:hypothetical protein